MSRRPAFQFYPSDWRNDPGLRLCSVPARGLWMEMICLMHEGEPYGYLTVQGRSIDAAALARLVGEAPGPVKRWLKELEENEVFTRDAAGAIFSRRMVRDEDLRERRAEIGRANGHKGATFGRLGSEHGKKGGRPRKETGEESHEAGENNRGPKPPQKPPQNPRPSSSSSSSSSKGDSSQTHHSVNRARVSAQNELPADVRAVMEAGGFITPPPDLGLLSQWAKAGADFEQDVLPIVRAVSRSVMERTGKSPFKLQLFDQPIREKMAADEREIERLRAVAARYGEPTH